MSYALLHSVVHSSVVIVVSLQSSIIHAGLTALSEVQYSSTQASTTAGKMKEQYVLRRSFCRDAYKNAADLNGGKSTQDTLAQWLISNGYVNGIICG